MLIKLLLLLLLLLIFVVILFCFYLYLNTTFMLLSVFSFFFLAITSKIRTFSFFFLSSCSVDCAHAQSHLYIVTNTTITFWYFRWHQRNNEKKEKKEKKGNKYKLNNMKQGNMYTKLCFEILVILCLHVHIINIIFKIGNNHFNTNTKENKKQK